MAPSSGYHMVTKAARAVRYAMSRSSEFVRVRLGSGKHPKLEAIPVTTRIAQQHSIHPLALLRQSRARVSRQTRLFSTAIAQLSRLGTQTIRPSALPTSATRAALRSSPFAPFASPLRPNLTGGTLPRGAGGYGLGGGGINAARHFSHTSSAQAHIVQNVHAAVRAFVLQGHKPLYVGNDSRTGAARFRAVGPAEARTHATLKNSARGPSAWETRGTSLDFHIAPAVTALGEKAVVNESVLGDLASDFARQLRDLAAVCADLKRLGQLGELSISNPDSATIRIRFPGCDADAVNALCDEVGVTRGIVREDLGWNEPNSDDAHDGELPAYRDVEMALLFPWAPTNFSPRQYKGSVYASEEEEQKHFDTAPALSQKPTAARSAMDGLEWRSMLSASPPLNAKSASTQHSFDWVDTDPAHSSPFDFESLAHSEAASVDGAPLAQTRTLTQNQIPARTGYEGVEGIYRFLREIESAEGMTRY